MKNGKTIFLFICAFVVIGCIFLGEIKYQSLATDSGFDTSYSGGGSSFGGGHSHSSSSSGGSGGASEDWIDAIFVFCFIGGTLGTIYALIKTNYLLQKVFALTSLSGFFLLNIKYFMQIQSPIWKILLNSFLIGLWLYLAIKILKLFQEMEKSDEIDALLSKPISAEDRKILDRCFQIYLDVQNAWMNFDYEKMRTIVTDELFHMYQTQLQTLEVKEEKNVMKTFNRRGSVLLSQKIDNELITTEIVLKVSFYDYIVNKDNRIVRGTDKRKVVMTYKLTFVHSEKIIKCPHCGAEIEKGNSICPYCKTKILSPMKNMRLAKKEVLKQE